MQRSFIDKLKRLDEGRRSFPGEHWLTMAAGLWFLKRSGGSPLARISSKAVGAALLYRAASGRDGLRRVWQNASGRPAASGLLRRAPAAGSSAGRGESGSDWSRSESTGRGRTGGYPDFR